MSVFPPHIDVYPLMAELLEMTYTMTTIKTINARQDATTRELVVPKLVLGGAIFFFFFRGSPQTLSREKKEQNLVRSNKNRRKKKLIIEWQLFNQKQEKR